MALETEAALFEANRSEWLKKHYGKFAVLQDEKVLGFFNEWENGFKAGCNELDVTRPFLVKEVIEKDRVLFIGGV